MSFNLPRLIGITGRAGSGKDTLADYLVRQHGFVKYSLSSPIKTLLNERFGWTDKNWEDRKWKERESRGCGFKIEQGFFHGSFSPRSWAQWLGTEVGRQIGGEDVWVNMMERELDAKSNGGRNRGFSMVIPDIRFDNEARRVHQRGGVIIKVNRPDVAPVSAHASEVGVSSSLVDVEVTNDKDITAYLRESMYALEGPVP